MRAAASWALVALIAAAMVFGAQPPAALHPSPETDIQLPTLPAED